MPRPRSERSGSRPAFPEPFGGAPEAASRRNIGNDPSYLRPSRLPPRPPRTRRLEFILTGGGVFLLLTVVWSWWAQGGSSRLAPATPVPTPPPAVTVAAMGPPAVPTATPKPPIEFSFTRFESEPAIVTGAPSAGVPNISGEAGIIVDVTQREVLYAKQPHKQMLIASTTKIMTAMVALDHAPMDRVFVVPPEATRIDPDNTVMGLTTGEQLSLEELLYGLMLNSGNDAAEAIAYGVGGGGASGRARFIGWMNEKAATLQLRNTRFANPSGLDDPAHYSSPYDLAVMGTALLGYPDLRTIVRTPRKIIESSKVRGRVHGWFGPVNLNSLLTSYRGAIGLKPGYTEDAGYTLVAAAERDGRTVVSVTLNSRRHFSDCAQLMDFGFRRASQLATSG